MLFYPPCRCYEARAGLLKCHCRKEVLTTVEARLSSCKPVYVRERPGKAVLTAEEVM